MTQSTVVMSFIIYHLLISHRKSIGQNGLSALVRGATRSATYKGALSVTSTLDPSEKWAVEGYQPPNENSEKKSSKKRKKKQKRTSERALKKSRTTVENYEKETKDQKEK
jgi:phenylpropionate dioxygenase-like ring-hydroxylating dioxygenase large terminal subunit